MPSRSKSTNTTCGRPTSSRIGTWICLMKSHGCLTDVVWQWVSANADTHSLPDPKENHYAQQAHQDHPIFGAGVEYLHSNHCIRIDVLSVLHTNLFTLFFESTV